MGLPSLAVLLLAVSASAQSNMTEGPAPATAAPQNGTCGMTGPGWTEAAIQKRIRAVYAEVWNISGVKGARPPLIFAPYDPERIAHMSHVNYDPSIPEMQITVFMTICDIARNEDEVAAILGHEIAHVELRHREAGEALEKTLIAKCGTCDDECCQKPLNEAAIPNETAADKRGVEYLSKPGSRFKPEAAISAMKHAKDHKWARADETVNPNHASRVQRAYELTEWVAKVKAAAAKP